jgi:hypothetical protein
MLLSLGGFLLSDACARACLTEETVDLPIRRSVIGMFRIELVLTFGSGTDVLISSTAHEWYDI